MPSDFPSIACLCIAYTSIRRPWPASNMVRCFNTYHSSSTRQDYQVTQSQYLNQNIVCVVSNNLTKALQCICSSSGTTSCTNTAFRTNSWLYQRILWRRKTYLTLECSIDIDCQQIPLQNVPSLPNSIPLLQLSLKSAYAYIPGTT